MNSQNDFSNEDVDYDLSPGERLLKMEAAKQTQDESDDDFPNLLPNFEEETKKPKSRVVSSDIEDEDDDDNKDDDKETYTDEDWVNTQQNLINYLIKEGAVNILSDLNDLPENIRNSNDVLKQIIEAEAQTRADYAIKQKFKGWQDPVVEDFIQAINSGASIEEFAQVYGGVDYSRVDMRNNLVQEQLIRENLDLQGYNRDEIEEMVRLFKDTDQLEKSAKIAQRQLIEKQNYDREMYKEELLQKEHQEQEQYSRYLSDIDRFVKTKQDIGGIYLTNDDRNVVKYLTDYEPVYTDDKGTQILRDETGQPVYMNSYELAMHNADPDDKLALQALIYKFVLNGFKLGGQNIPMQKKITTDIKNQLLSGNKKIQSRVDRTPMVSATAQEQQLINAMMKYKSQNKGK